MLDHVSIGVRDLARTKRFYDAALAPLGYRCLRDSEEMLGYGGETVTFSIGPAERPVPADKASGLHFCFTAPGRRRSRLSQGRADRRPAGQRRAGARPEYSADYYAAFVVDPDGYRIEAYCRAA